MSIGIPDAANQLQNQNQVYSRQRISAFPIEIREQDNISIHSMDDRASIPEQHTPQPPEQHTPLTTTLVLPQEANLQHQEQTIQATVNSILFRVLFQFTARKIFSSLKLHFS